MKIALVGAQGVGKTTVANHLAQHNWTIVPEVARDCPYPIDKEADFRAEWWMLSHAMIAEWEAVSKNQKVVADRSVVDLVVYSRMVNKIAPERLSDKELLLIQRAVIEWLAMHPYDCIIRLKVSDDVWKNRDLNDGFRSTDFDLYQTLNAGFDSALKLATIQGIEIHTIINDGNQFELIRDVHRVLGL